MTKPESIKNVITLSQKLVINCPKCGRAFKKPPSLEKHIAGCDGKHLGGMPTGHMTKRTKDIMEVKKELQDRIAAQANRLLTAQLNMALGTRDLFKRTKTKQGKKELVSVLRVTEEADFILFLEATQDGYKAKVGDVEYFYMAQTNTGSTAALNNLFDRAFGKAAQGVVLEGETKLIIETRKGRGSFVA